MTNFARILSLCFLFLLAACAGEKGKTPVAASGKGYYKIGKPYEINGRWYYPREDYSYDETGISSWYNGGPNNITANGEVFNKDELTAAHQTLPLPTLARVTNLENGRSIVVRINDRGPFAGERIIDVTQRVSQLLQFEKNGTAKVRVQVLADESKAIADAMRHYGSDRPIEVASAPQAAPRETVVSQQLTAPPEQQPQQVLASVPLPTTAAETHKAMETIKPVPEVKQLAVTGTNRIYIQAGAFSKMENAQKLKSKVDKVGKTTIVKFTRKNETLYRVRLGPIATVDKADTLLKKVVKTGADNARIFVE